MLKSKTIRITLDSETAYVLRAVLNRVAGSPKPRMPRGLMDVLNTRLGGVREPSLQFIQSLDMTGTITANRREDQESR